MYGLILILKSVWADLKTCMGQSTIKLGLRLHQSPCPLAKITSTHLFEKTLTSISLLGHGSHSSPKPTPWASPSPSPTQPSYPPGHRHLHQQRRNGGGRGGGYPAASMQTLPLRWRAQPPMMTGAGRWTKASEATRTMRAEVVEMARAGTTACRFGLASILLCRRR